MCQASRASNKERDGRWYQNKKVGRSRLCNSHCSYVSAVPLPQEPLLIKGPCDLPLLFGVSLDGGLWRNSTFWEKVDRVESTNSKDSLSLTENSSSAFNLGWTHLVQTVSLSFNNSQDLLMLCLKVSPKSRGGRRLFLRRDLLWKHFFRDARVATEQNKWAIATDTDSPAGR